MSAALQSPVATVATGSPSFSADRACELAIIGAGPYGLGANAALRDVDLDVRVFGTPMSFWRERMPVGMLMKSPWTATSFAGPDSGVTLDDYERSLGTTLPRPLPLHQFLAYSEWFRERTRPAIDERWVERLVPRDAGFELQLADGQRIAATRVVVAAGIAPFGARPRLFDELPAERAFHSTELTDPSAYAGARVAVIGAGQSGLESAALLHEAGADVVVLVRAPAVHWLIRSKRLHALGPVAKMLYAPSDIGPAGLSRLVAMPMLFGRLPRSMRERLDRRALRAAGTAWLVPRLRDVAIKTGVEVSSADCNHAGIQLALSSGERLPVDHVVMGTGFRVDVSRYGFLPRELLGRLRCVHGYPVLSRWFESSLPGLYFLGAPAAGTFGPLLRFVAGAEFAATRLARHMRGLSAAGRTRIGASRQPV
jgi:NADPH-dependent 2,4-dienoyl-CoA reductase/sulfur reductase-like enzyme